MKYQKDGVIKDINEIKALYANISFGPNTLVELGWAEVTEQPDDVVLDYKIARAIAYGPINDQLDMMYWDSVNGTTTWLDHVAAVKAAHPKP